MAHTQRFIEQTAAIEMPAEFGAAIRGFLATFSESTNWDSSFPARALRAAIGLQQEAFGAAGVLPIDAARPDWMADPSEMGMITVQLTMPRAVLISAAAEGGRLAVMAGSKHTSYAEELRLMDVNEGMM